VVSTRRRDTLLISTRRAIVKSQGACAPSRFVSEAALAHPRLSECLRREVEGNIGVSGATQQKGVQPRRVPVIEEPECIRVVDSRANQLGV
jgi:hypothetical protein